jgi:hypothetical protein
MPSQAGLRSNPASPLPNREQNYVIAPQQGLLSGYRANGSVKQFVAMPMGDEYTVERQLTGEEFIGGIQLEIIPRLRETATFKRTPSGPGTRNGDDQNHFELVATPRKLGLHPGQRILMQDHRPKVLYEHPRRGWEPSKDLVEPAAYSNLYENPPAFIRELYDSPSYMSFDLSSSLIISVIKPIKMTIGPFDDGSKVLCFSCSPLARMSDIRRFLREPIGAMLPEKTWIRWSGFTLIIKGEVI